MFFFGSDEVANGRGAGCFRFIWEQMSCAMGAGIMDVFGKVNEVKALRASCIGCDMGIKTELGKDSGWFLGDATHLVVFC